MGHSPQNCNATMFLGFSEKYNLWTVLLINSVYNMLCYTRLSKCQQKKTDFSQILYLSCPSSDAE